MMGQVVTAELNEYGKQVWMNNREQEWLTGKCLMTQGYSEKLNPKNLQRLSRKCEKENTRKSSMTKSTKSTTHTINTQSLKTQRTQDHDSSLERSVMATPQTSICVFSSFLWCLIEGNMASFPVSEICFNSHPKCRISSRNKNRSPLAFYLSRISMLWITVQPVCHYKTLNLCCKHMAAIVQGVMTNKQANIQATTNVSIYTTGFHMIAL